MLIYCFGHNIYISQASVYVTIYLHAVMTVLAVRFRGQRLSPLCFKCCHAISDLLNDVIKNKAYIPGILILFGRWTTGWTTWFWRYAHRVCVCEILNFQQMGVMSSGMSTYLKNCSCKHCCVGLVQGTSMIDFANPWTVRFKISCEHTVRTIVPMITDTCRIPAF